LALDINAGDKVITTPITFAASANCVRYCGGEVVFSDIDPEDYTLNIEGVRKLLENAPKNTYKGIIPVDFAGKAVKMDAFKALAEDFDLWIIEDACHAPGGFFIDNSGNMQNCGSGNFADLAIFSFHPVKHITSGEGGMITTNHEGLYKKILNLRTHGIQQDLSKRIFDDSLWYYEMQELGFNYRLTDFQAALGMSQLDRAAAGINKRHEIAQKYLDAFKDVPEITDKNGLGASGKIDLGHAYHLYVIEVEERKELHAYLREKNIWAQIHYVPVHLMPYYRQFGWKEGDMPYAESYYKRCISLPIFPTLKVEEQDYVISCIKEFFVK
jgi:dTDP-4-amino-4,6-dideoxygalactose transaminase